MHDEVGLISEYFYELASSPVVIEMMVPVVRDLEPRHLNKKNELLVRIHSDEENRMLLLFFWLVWWLNI